jgi:hypothetical protein
VAEKRKYQPVLTLHALHSSLLFQHVFKKSMFLGFGLSGHGQFLPPAYEVKREPAILAQLPQVRLSRMRIQSRGLLRMRNDKVTW